MYIIYLHYIAIFGPTDEWGGRYFLYFKKAKMCNYYWHYITYRCNIAKDIYEMSRKYFKDVWILEVKKYLLVGSESTIFGYKISSQLWPYACVGGTTSRGSSTAPSSSPWTGPSSSTVTESGQSSVWVASLRNSNFRVWHNPLLPMSLTSSLSFPENVTA